MTTPDEDAPPHQDDEIRQLRDTVQNLQIALEHRDVIGCAKGILMAQDGLDQDQAFQALVRLSQSCGKKLYVVAQDVVDGLSAPSIDAPTGE